MVEVVSVKFKGRGKTYYFDPNGVDCAAGDQVVVETSKGLELCECIQPSHPVTDERIIPPLRPVVRKATPDDLRIAALCKSREKEAFGICEKKIAEHGLEMKLVDVECTFDGSKILFFFTADGRVDFRALVKDLAGVFRTRIELRQIGVRDEAKMLGGIGMCGRPFCCSQFLEDFAPVSTKMAKVQSLSLNPTKISGCCGRLMCCLRYEEEAYEELVKTVPKLGAFVETVAGYGNVTQVNLLRQTVKVRLDNEEEIRSYRADEVAAIPGGRPRNGEAPPHILEVKPREPEEEPEETEADLWRAPALFAEYGAEEAAPDPVREEARRERGGGNNRRVKARSGKKPPQEPREPAPSPAPAPGASRHTGGATHHWRGGPIRSKEPVKAGGSEKALDRKKEAPAPKPQNPQDKKGAARRHYRKPRPKTEQN